MARTQPWGILLAEATHTLRQANLDETDRQATWLLEEVLGCNRAALMAYPERLATPEQVARLEAMIGRRMAGEPVQYILGHAPFFGLTLQVTPDVLIPRPETEQVVEAALDRIKKIPGPRVLDIGTGSGCIPIAIKKMRPDATVSACDVSEAALAVATHNAQAHEADIHFFLADVLAESFATNQEAFDLIISNPPYIALEESGTLPPDVRDHEPHLALFAGEDPLLFYKAIAHHAPTLLKPGGKLVFETHAYHAEAVRDLLLSMKFMDVECQKDLAGLPRIVLATR